MAKRSPWLVGVFAAAATGCLAFVDLAGLSTGEARDDADASDASDAPTGLDGSADGRDAATSDSANEGGTKSPCAMPHDFCADFDNGPLGQGWTRGRNEAPATLALDDLALSPLRSMRSTQPRKTTDVHIYSIQVQALGPTWQRTVFQGDVFIAPPQWQQTDTNFAIMELSFASDTTSTGTYLFVAEANTTGTIEHLGEPERYVPSDPTPYGRWVHVLVDFDPAGTLHYEIDGKPTDGSFQPVVPGPNPLLALAVGVISYNNPVPAVDVRWDNVFVDLR